jgi:mRNA interferase RelE/StbE
MIVKIDESFDEDFGKIKDVSVLRRVDQAIDRLEAAKSLREVTNVKAIKNHPNYYRLRSGDYRIGFYYAEEEQTIELLAISHRSVFYRYFP